MCKSVLQGLHPAFRMPYNPNLVLMKMDSKAIQVAYEFAVCVFSGVFWFFGVAGSARFQVNHRKYFFEGLEGPEVQVGANTPTRSRKNTHWPAAGYFVPESQAVDVCREFAGLQPALQ